MIVQVAETLHDALVREAAESKTNKAVLVNTILSERYGIPYEPSAQSARRTVPFGGGPSREAA